MKGKKTVHILVDLTNLLLAEGITNLLDKNGYENITGTAKEVPDTYQPHVILVDINTLNQQLFSRYPDSKVLLVDTGVEKERIISALLSYRLHGVLSPHTEFDLFEKALNVVREGQIWVDNNTVKAFLHQGGTAFQPGRMDGVTDREKEIIDFVCQGFTNKEIATRLNLSEHTVKAHLNRIFRKFNASSRSKLITLVMTGEEG